MSDEEVLAPPSKKSLLSDVGHAALDLLGLVPVLGEPADLANAAWYAAEGNHLEAGLSLISIIPVVGDVIGKGGKLARRFGGKLPGKAVDVVKSLDFPEVLGKFKNHPKLGPHVEKIAAALESWRDGLLKNFSDSAGVGKPATCPKLLERQKQAAELMENAAAAEKQVTPALTELARQQGMKMEGLSERLKKPDSLTDKLTHTAADDIRDALRYTMVSKSDDLAANAKNTLGALEAQGYKVIRVKDTFRPGVPYKGLNTQLRSPSGQLFELQFHTAQSFHVKQNLTHDMYKEFGRLPDADPRKAALGQQMSDISNSIPTPPGLSDALEGFPK